MQLARAQGLGPRDAPRQTDLRCGPAPVCVPELKYNPDSVDSVDYLVSLDTPVTVWDGATNLGYIQNISDCVVRLDKWLNTLFAPVV